MFKINNKDRRRSGVFIVNFEHISHLILVFLLLTLNMQFTITYVRWISNKVLHTISTFASKKSVQNLKGKVVLTQTQEAS